jgi:hypothetical protein|nr:MAG TPA: hypothetical protein [Caudoviricetes sp.]
MLNFKENDTVICSKSTIPWITQFKVYTIQKNDEGKLTVRDDDGQVWSLEYLTETGNIFTLLTENIFRKEPFDLNKLTLEELDEYLQLATALEEAEYLMNNFIERMTK